MIKSIYASSPHIVASSASGGLSHSGMMRWNGIGQRVEVMDASMNWIPMNDTMAQVGLTDTALAAINWVCKKMEEEKKLDELCEIHPGLADMRDKFEMMKQLVSMDTV